MMINLLIEKIKNKEIRICVIGLGYVGLPLLKIATEKGFNTIGLDTDIEKVKKAIKEEVKATTNLNESLNDSDCFIICVPTPIDENHRPDLRFVESATQAVSKYLKKDSIVILESTVAPGTTEEIIVPLLNKSGLEAGKDIYVAQCPERIDPGNKKWNVRNIPRVIGGIDEESAVVARMLYENIIEAEIVKMNSTRAAEAVKIVENTFRDVNIAFINELAKSFDKINIDIFEVIKGASTKPFGFMPHLPGCGVGGHCIAIDPYYLIEKAEKSGFNHNFLKLAREINNSMPEYTIKKIIEGLNEVGKCIKNSKLALLGLAYKGGVGDTRESPAFPILNKLEKLGANIRIFDPYVLDKSTVKSLDEALNKSDFIVIVTDHPEFKKITAEKLKNNGIMAVIDGRNILDKERIKKMNIIYKGIGR